MRMLPAFGINGRKRSNLKGIATGYALNEDGMWHLIGASYSNAHSETTVGMLRYFDIPMNAEDADAFAAGFLSETETEFNAKLEQIHDLGCWFHGFFARRS